MYDYLTAVYYYWTKKSPSDWIIPISYTCYNYKQTQQQTNNQNYFLTWIQNERLIYVLMDDEFDALWYDMFCIELMLNRGLRHQKLKKNNDVDKPTSLRHKGTKDKQKKTAEPWGYFSCSDLVTCVIILHHNAC